MADAIAEAGLEADDTVVEAALAAGLRPQQVLDRPQPGGPGSAAVRTTARRVAERAGALSAEFDARRARLRRAEEALTAAVDAVLAGDRT